MEYFQQLASEIGFCETKHVMQTFLCHICVSKRKLDGVLHYSFLFFPEFMSKTQIICGTIFWAHFEEIIMWNVKIKVAEYVQLLKASNDPFKIN